MSARKERNLLEQALRIAQSSGRSYRSRLGLLLQEATDWLGLSSASLFLPAPDQRRLSHRFSTHLDASDRDCLIPYGEGSAGRAAATHAQDDATAQQLHVDEPRGAGENAFVSLPLLDGRRLAAVLTLGSSEGAVPRASVRLARQLAPVLAMTVAGLVAQEQAVQARRNLSLISSLGKLLSSPTAPGKLLPMVIKLFTGSRFCSDAVLRVTLLDGGKTKLFKGRRSEARPANATLLLAEQRLSGRALAAGVIASELLPAGAPARQALSVPLINAGAPLGTLTLFGGTDLTDAEQLEVVETVAGLLVGAVAGAMCKQQIQIFDTENDKKLKELSILYRMSNTMLSTIKLNKLIHLTLTALTAGPTHFFDRAMLFLSNERSGMLLGMLGVTRETAPSLSVPQGAGEDILSSRWDISEEDMAAQRKSDFCRQVQGKRLELDCSLNVASQAVLEKRLVYLPEESGVGGEQIAPGRGALAASPLIAHGQAVGVVLVDNALSHAPITQEHLRFLQLFTNQAGMAIENSMLYNKIEDANLQLSEAQEHLLQKERLAAIGEMAAGIAHELKGPLVSIGGFAGRLARKLPPETSEWAHADLIVREVLRLEGILSEILLFSKKTTICYARCNISDIVRESLAVVTPPLEEKQIEVSTKFPRQKLMLLGDGQQLKQVFINIILNALDAMGTGGKLVVQVTAAELDGKEAVCVKIADTGGGIPLEQLNSIFTPFFTTKESGTGLGLPIANRIITNHGGKIHITNSPGLGVEFRVVLPKHW